VLKKWTRTRRKVEADVSERGRDALLLSKRTSNEREEGGITHHGRE